MKLENIDLSRELTSKLKELERDLKSLMELMEIPSDRYNTRIDITRNNYIRSAHLDFSVIFSQARATIENEISILKKQIKKL